VSQQFQVAIDATDPHELCEFWAAALAYQVEPSDAEFIRAMVAQGHAQESDTIVVRGELRWASGAACVDPEGVQPRLYFQQVPEPKAGKNRVHLDLRSADRDHEVARLEALGARRLYEGSQGPHTWVTMADPEGNEFCVS